MHSTYARSSFPGSDIFSGLRRLCAVAFAAATTATGSAAEPATGAAATTASAPELAGKVAIVTGASANLGRGFAVALARNGADIVVHYRDERARADADETARLIRTEGRRALLVPGDFMEIANVRHLFDEAIREFGRVDILINNAGVIFKKPLAEVTEEEFDQSFGVNSKAPFFAMQEAAKRMSDNGRIINIGSSLMASTTANYSVYASAKISLEQMTRALAREIGARSITVNVVAPGPVNTPFFHGQETPESVKYATNLAVARRLAEVEDIVPLVEFLASPRSQWITAHTLFINGGYLAR